MSISLVPDLLPLFAFFLALAGATALGTSIVLGHASRASLLDIPNHRSSHSVPTPRGGGLSIALLWVAGLPMLGVFGFLDWPTVFAFTGGGVPIAVIGWIDDHGHVPSWTRLVVHFAAASWAVAALGGVPHIAYGTGTLSLGIVGSMLAVVGLVWMINLYNFMDGIDGIAGVEALSAGIGMAALLSFGGAGGLALVPLGLAATAAGFLLWNWEPAKIFMGDVGSGLLGFAFGAVALAAQRSYGIPLMVTLLPFGVFIIDATYTLMARLRGGEQITTAHRSHVYQRLLRAGWSARAVCGILVLLNAVLVCVAWTSLRWPVWLIPAAAAATGLVAATGAALLRRSRAAL